MSLTARILVSVVIWFLRLVVFAVLEIVGIPLIALAAYGRLYKPRSSTHFNRTVTQFAWPLWVWSNDEDGVDGLRGGDFAQAWWARKTEGWSAARRILIWSAFRNPVNHLRYVPVLTPRFHPERIRFVGLDHEMSDGEGGWFFIWQGFYSAFRYETKHFRVWVGWCFKPDDVHGMRTDDTRLPRADFKCQFKRVV